MHLCLHFYICIVPHNGTCLTLKSAIEIKSLSLSSCQTHSSTGSETGQAGPVSTLWPLQPWIVGSLLQPAVPLSCPTWGPPVLLRFPPTAPTGPSRNQKLQLCCCWAGTAQQSQIGMPSSSPPHKLGITHTKKKTQKNRDWCMCMRALLLVKCTRPLADSILLSHLTLSLSIPPLPPPPTTPSPSSCVRPILPFYYTYLVSVKQTHHQSPTLPYRPPTHPPSTTPSPPHDPISPPYHLVLSFIYHQFKLS